MILNYLFIYLFLITLTPTHILTTHLQYETLSTLQYLSSVSPPLA